MHDVEVRWVGSACVAVSCMLLAFTAAHSSAETRYVNQNSPAPTPPYTNWAGAAVTIQEAVDVALPGDDILVTNGVYQSGARNVYGMSNRVALTKPVRVQSVNGPALTKIVGYHVPDVGNGPEAVRCVYLTNGASLSGFTLTNGGTQASCVAPSAYQVCCGGGVWCETVSEVISNCVLTGNSASYGGGAAYNGTLNNCTVSSNSATFGGGGYGSSLNDCAVLGNSAGFSGGGAKYCVVSSCTLVGNSAQLYGGGAYGSPLNGCLLSGNSASYGGGVFSCTVTNSTLRSNSASYGGGAYDGSLQNCAVTGNSAFLYGGGAYSGRLNNCTITGNSSQYKGGGASGDSYVGGTLANCIIFYNRAWASGDNYSDNLALTNCCTTSLFYVEDGNLRLEPQLASASHLSAASPCRGAGSPAFTSGRDIDGELWANPPSIGCDEHWTGSLTGAISVAISFSNTNAATGFELEVQAAIAGRVSASRWEFGDGIVVSNRPFATHAWAAPGDYTVVLRAYNESYPGGVAAAGTVHVLTQPTHYVAVGSLNPVPPFNSWATAADNIQDAVDAVTAAGALVLVSNGVYQTGAREIFGMSNRVTVTKPIRLQSVNGPSVTTIAGYHVPGTANGDAAVRCVYLGGGSTLAGLTLRDGATQTVGNLDRQGSGGGVWCESLNEVVSNCVVLENSAIQGGGAVRGILTNCTLISNSASDSGGAAIGSLLGNCTLTGNSAGQYGGGTHSCTLDNCTLTLNSADSGGGASFSTLNNCTVTDNSAASGGGEFLSIVYGSIVYYNTASSIGDNYYLEFYLDHCCTTPLPLDGTDNLSVEPRLVNRAAGNLRLQSNSPCINGGLNSAAMGSVDLDGNRRIVGGTVDIGAYEFQSPASVISYGWLHRYGLPTDGTADYADFDQDGMNTWQEWVAGTDPTNAASLLHLLMPIKNPAGLRLSWNSDAQHTYFVQRALLLGSPEFLTIATNIPGQEVSTTFCDPEAPAQGAAIYRVGVTSTGNPAPIWLKQPALVDARLTLSWSSVDTRYYTLELATNLGAAQTFTVLQSNIAGFSGTTTWTDTNSVRLGPRFYRVRVEN